MYREFAVPRGVPLQTGMLNLGTTCMDVAVQIAVVSLIPRRPRQSGTGACTPDHDAVGNTCGALQHKQLYGYRSRAIPHGLAQRLRSRPLTKKELRSNSVS